ncbi:MAG: Methyltransferase type 11 [Candidatus Moranbacteria bacterium GW2011_GWF2_34_56]|nr:MAG: Methyltransferase type 11 [Candidatus Moranbacteria bacterium GW2011_GWF1_34_10]KKP65358.1 MAG: Methyltransferase type 11 [Candidatus Moranbacteria bacterium GW2011_GWF2_34_56]HBI17450.1 hypothetical protein [Candidatus Moranbacteria bacterium]
MHAEDYEALFYKFPNQTAKQENETLESFILKHISKTSRILEIGCGSGHWMKVVTMRNCNVFGIDIDYDRLILANKSQKGKLVLSDAKHLPFRDASFNVALLLWTIQEISDDLVFARVLEEIARIIAYGGNLIIAENRTYNFSGAGEKSFLGIIHKGVLENKRLRLFSKNSLDECLETFNFRRMDYETVGDSFFENYQMGT